MLDAPHHYYCNLTYETCIHAESPPLTDPPYRVTLSGCCLPVPALDDELTEHAQLAELGVAIEADLSPRHVFVPERRVAQPC